MRPNSYPRLLSLLVLSGTPFTGALSQTAGTPDSLVLVAEGTLHDDKMYLPVTVHGRAATLFFFFGDLPGVIEINGNKVRRLGFTIPSEGNLDSLSIGTSVKHNVSIVSDPNRADFGDVPGLPPVIGEADVRLLKEYDIVVDGPAHRVRLYLPHSSSQRVNRASPASKTSALPPEVRAAACTPIRPSTEDYYFFTLNVNGHPVTGTFLWETFAEMDSATAHLLALTEQTPTVKHVSHRWLTGGWIRRHFEGLEATGVHLTLGSRAFHDTPIFLKKEVYRPGPNHEPTINLTLANIRDQVFVLSPSTGQVCLGAP